MKKIISILATLMMCFTLSSCVTAAQAQVDGVYYDDNIDISLVVTYGTPYYNAEGLLLYYIYRDMYYYPYYYHNRYYMHRYSRPLPPPRARMYKPVPRDFYRHEPPRKHHVTPPNRSTQHMRPNTHSAQPRPNGSIRPNTNIRPNNRGGGMSRSSTRTTVGGGNHGHFGGKHK